MNASELQTWLVAKVAEETGAAPDNIDINAPFARLGLDSTSAVALTGEIEELLATDLDPTLVFEFPTIAKLSAHLAGHGA